MKKMFRIITIVFVISITIYGSRAQNFPARPMQCLISSKVNIQPSTIKDKSFFTTGTTIEPFNASFRKNLLDHFAQWLNKNKSLTSYKKYSPYNSNALTYDEIDLNGENIDAYKIGEELVLDKPDKILQLKNNLLYADKTPVFDLNKNGEIDRINAVTFFELWNIDPLNGQFSKEVKNFGLNIQSDNIDLSLFNFKTNNYSKPYYKALNEITYSLNNENVLAENVVYDLRLSYNTNANGEDGSFFDLMNPINTNYYHFLDHSQKTEFITQILNLIKSQNCKVYKQSRGNIELIRTLEANEIINEFHDQDTIWTEDYETYEMGQKIITREKFVSDIQGIRFYETWYFDPETFSVKKIVNAISLLEYAEEWEGEGGEIIAKPHLYIRLNNKVKNSEGKILEEKLYNTGNNIKIAPGLNKVYSEGQYYFVNNEGFPLSKNKYVWAENSLSAGAIKVFTFASESVIGKLVENENGDIELFGSLKVFKFDDGTIVKRYVINDNGEIGLIEEEFQEVYYDNKYGRYGYIDNTGKEIVPCIYNKVERTQNGFFIVTMNDKNGILESTGKEILPCTCSKIEPLSNGFFKYAQNGYSGLIDSTGKVITDAIYTEIIIGDIIKLEKDGLWGIMNKDGKMISGFVYDYINDYYNGLAKFSKNDLDGFIDPKGEEIIPAKYVIAEDFKKDSTEVYESGKIYYINKKGEKLSEGKFNKVRKQTEKISIASVDIGDYYIEGLIDTTGNGIFSKIYNEIEDFNDGIAKVRIGFYSYGYIDLEGNEIIPCTYESIEEFKNGVAKATNKDYKIGYVDLHGKVIIPFVYRSIEDFHNGIAKANKENKYGYLDKNGKEIIPFKYDEIIDFSDDLKILYNGEIKDYEIDSGKISFYDANTKQIINTNYYRADKISNLLMVFYRDKKIGFLDKNLKEINYGKYDWMPYSRHSYLGMGYNLVYKGETDSIFNKGKFGAIDSLGNEVIPCKYNWIFDFKENLNVTRVFNGKVYEEGHPAEGKFGIIDKAGKEILPIQYDYIYNFYGNTAIVFKGKNTDSYYCYPGKGKYGIINDKGILIVPLKYDHIEKSYYDDYYEATLGDKTYKFDINGKPINLEY